MSATPSSSDPTKGVLSDAWRLYRQHWQHFAAIGLVVYLVVGVLTAVLTRTLGWVGAVLATALSVVGVFWLQGALVKAVEDVRDGRVDLSLVDTFRAARPHLARVGVTGMIAGVAIAIGFVLLAVPGLYLLTIWVVVIPVVVLEGREPLPALGRSRDLVRGHGWNVFGLIIITFVVLMAVGLVMAIVLTPLPDGAQGLTADVIAGGVTGPWVATAWALLYYRLHGPRTATTDTPPDDLPRGDAPPPAW